MLVLLLVWHDRLVGTVWAAASENTKQIAFGTRSLILVHYIQVRIAGSAMVLATSCPSRSILIAEYALGSIGLAPLVFEVSLVLLLRYVHSGL